jgi:hypothetical protein
MNKYYSKLDSERFGFEIAKVDFTDENPEIIVEGLIAYGFKLIIARVDINNIQLINKLENLGFLTKDIQLTYRYNLPGELNQFRGESGVKIRVADTADIDDMKRIAGESFKNYGHYFQDFNLDRTKCDEIYVDWIQRSIYDRNVADIIYVAETEKGVAGFLSFKEKSEGEVLYSAGVQGAVSEKYRGKSFFKAIVKAGLEWSRSRDHKWQEHNVLVNNYAVNRSFIQLGFFPFKSFVTLHCWPDTGSANN